VQVHFLPDRVPGLATFANAGSLLSAEMAAGKFAEFIRGADLSRQLGRFAARTLTEASSTELAQPESRSAMILSTGQPATGEKPPPGTAIRTDQLPD
jgi:hypothetical protein